MKPTDRHTRESKNREWRRINMKLKSSLYLLTAAVSALLASCSSYPGHLWSPTIYHAVGGTITGLTGTGLVLQNNGGNNLPVAAGATSFTFTTDIASGGSYNVTVLSQPSTPAQTCGVTSGSGVVASANITSVHVTCATNLYTIGGTVSGLTGTGLVLQDNGGNNLPVAAGATSFTFSTPIASGGSYNVTAFSQPSSPSQNCGVTSGNGIVTSADITSVQVTCTTLVPPTQLFAYVTNRSSGTLDAYAVQANGALALVPGSPFNGGVSPNGVGADPSGKFLYVANILSDEVSGYLIAADGSLQPIPGSPFLTASGPVSVKVDPTGRFAYVMNCGSDCSGTGTGNISAFTIGATGALTPIAGSPFAAGVYPYEMAVQSSGDFAYVVNASSGTVSVHSIQPATGALAQIAGSPYATGTFPISVAITPQNTFLFTVNTQSNNVSAFAINNDGSLLPVGGSPFSTGTFSSSVTVDTTGRFVYVVAGTGVYGFAIGSSGTLTPLPGSPFVAGRAPFWIRIDPTNHFVYVVNAADDTVTGYALDPSTGALTVVPGSPFAAGTLPSSIVLVSVPQ